MDAEGSSDRLQAQLAQQLDRRCQQSRLRTLKSSPPESVDFSSNDFLSLASSAELRTLFYNELSHTDKLGSTGSRLLDGNSKYAEHLEKEIAGFHSCASGLLVNSGLDANIGIFSCIPQPGDTVIYDELIHASVHDGMKASRASEKIPFAHNSVSDLRRLLSRPGQDKNVFVAVESVYSMDGDLAPLAEIVKALEQSPGNAYLIVDEAHATGIYGEKGRGRVCELGLEEKVYIRLHTFGKALASSGGKQPTTLTSVLTCSAIILCPPITRQYLINYARPLIYTTFMPFPVLAMIKAVYTFMMQGRTEALAERLLALISSLYSELADMRISNETPFEIPHSCPNSPIIPLFTKQPRELAQFCQDAGFNVRAIVAPTVPSHSERVRVCLHSGNTLHEIANFVSTLRSWIRLQTEREGSVCKASL